MNLDKATIWCVLSALLPAQDAARERTALDEARFTALQGRLQRDDTAPWRSIPWRIDLLPAQRAAAASHRPIFVWAMDGHPLGCT